MMRMVLVGLVAVVTVAGGWALLGGTARFSVTVPVAELPPTTRAGLIDSEVGASGGRDDCAPVGRAASRVPAQASTTAGSAPRTENRSP